ncbi:MAG: RhaT l-rhamnose-proton symport 2 [Candidatus Sulfotelmatobacter sp.]|nr:RhaT l-rhamnose-proton symport 2 [Candidatus Sulfotelmatobacter sp.]
MTSQTVQAILLVLCAAIMNAAYSLPMKLNKKWEWEHSWFAFSILGVAVVPTLIALLTVPRLWATYNVVSTGTLAAMVVFGASWGVSLVFFGLALTRLGLAITFAVCLGTSAAVGALTPLLAQHPDLVMTRQGELILLGVLAIVLGVSLCGVAGKSREAALQQASASTRKGFWGGFTLAFISGILGSMLNLGLAFGGSIQHAAQQNGASLAMMSNAVWLPCLYAGFLPGAIYCYILMRRKGTVRLLGLPGTWYYWVAAASMGLLWFGSIILYSISTIKLGDLGTSIGWPLFLASIVVASTFFGVLTGEWKRTGTRPLRFMIVGVGFLVVAIAVLSYAGRA